MKRLVCIAAAAGLAAALAAPPAFARGDDVRKSGGCSSSSNWKIKLGQDDSGIEAEFEVDQNVTGDKWRVVMKHDGARFFRGTKTTRGRSGSFEIQRVVNDNAGSDRIAARAVNTQTDEVCRGSASI